jgi:hypothetical protein
MKLLENVLHLTQLLQLMQTQRIHPKYPLNKLIFAENGMLKLLNMLMNKITQTLVGADLSGASPIHRPLEQVLMSAL